MSLLHARRPPPSPPARTTRLRTEPPPSSQPPQPRPRHPLDSSLLQTSHPLRVQQAHRVAVISTRRHKVLSSNNLSMGEEAEESRERKWECEQELGRGKFGVVVAGRGGGGERVAIKRVRVDRRYNSRQLNLLKQLKHPSIIGLIDHYLARDAEREFLYLVMPQYPADLATILKTEKLHPDKLRVYLWQLLSALSYLQQEGVAHRDVKPHNVLVDSCKNKVVLCDFGSAKQLMYGQPNLSYVCGRSYRAPELLLGSTAYSTQIDMWSLGCLTAEAINGCPLFKSESSLQQLIAIMQALGTPTAADMEDMSSEFSKKQYHSFPKLRSKQWQHLLLTKEHHLIDLVSRMLVYSPRKRLQPAEALSHPYFQCLAQTGFVEKYQLTHGPLPTQLLPQSQDSSSRHKRESSGVKTVTTAADWGQRRLDGLTVRSIITKRKLF